MEILQGISLADQAETLSDLYVFVYLSNNNARAGYLDCLNGQGIFLSKI